MASEATSTSLLIEWANQQDAWIRQIVLDVLASKSRPSTDKIDGYLALLLDEKHLGPGEPPSIPQIAQVDPTGQIGDPLTLRAVKVTAGVNALKPDQTLACGTRLTVVYGENGSGKSGYVRVLKRLAGVRSAEEILPNVHKTGDQPAPAADIEFEVAGKPQPCLGWQNEFGVPPFTQISVFDSRAADAHVDEELSYIYTPGELALFPIVQDAIDQVRTKLTDRITRSSDTRNPFLAHFKKGTKLYPAIERLGASTDLVWLKQQAALTDDDKAHKGQLESEIESLRSTDILAQLKVVTDQQQLVQAAASALAAVESFDQPTYQSALVHVVSATAADKAVSVKAFENSGIPGVLEGPWRAFMDAGEKYLEAQGLTDYPAQPSDCIYCRQPLTEAAAALVHKYRELCAGEARRALEGARRELGRCCAGLEGLAPQVAIAGLTAEIEAGRGNSVAVLIDPLKKVAEFVEAVAAGSTTLPSIAELPAASTTAETLLATLKDTGAALRSKSEERARLLSTKQAEFAELEARVTLANLWPQIEKKVSDSKWADGAASVVRGFTGTLRSLTEQAKVATQTLLNSNFESIFVDEARQLRAPTVILDFPGVRGQAVRRKVVADRKPSQVLSEGEQKVVALADFLAETRIRQPPGPVVFDDPVNSLDVRRMEEVTSRIIALTPTNQVIVFTHNVMFAALLLDKADKNTTQYMDIRAEDGPGVISPGTSPKTTSYTDLVGKIKSKIDAAKKATDAEARESLVESGYSLLRSLCEVLTVRGLLKSVSERHRAMIRVDSLAKINVSELGESINVVMDVYKRANLYTEAHSHSAEQLGQMPTVSELENDLARLEQVKKTHDIVQ